MNKISPRTKSSTADFRRLLEPVVFMLILLLVTLTVYIGSLGYYTIKSLGDYYTGTITVSGYGEMELKPDVQKLLIEISPAQRTTAKVATSTAEYVNKVKAYLVSKGVLESDIKISTINTTVVNLRGENIDISNKIAADIEKIDPKRINVTLGEREFENFDRVKSRILEIALTDAKINATRISQSLGADLGKVVTYYDNNDPQWKDGNLEDDYSNEDSESKKITSAVTVTYQIR